MKVKIKKKLKPLTVIDGQDHLTKEVIIGMAIRLPQGTLVRDVVYYGPRGPRQAEFSTDHGEIWIRGTCWSDLPLSEGTKIRYV